MDRFSLEDIIEFQGVSFEILRGYYFNEGFNNKVKEVIRYLFEKRLELKQEKNKAEMIYKLIMNSSYGRNLMKAIEHETHMFIIRKTMKYSRVGITIRYTSLHVSVRIVIK